MHRKFTEEYQSVVSRNQHWIMCPHRLTRLLIFVALATSTGCSYRQQEVTFHNQTVTLAGTLTLPSGTGPHPAVVFIHGSGPDSRENYRFYTDLFARHGIATLIYDKRGVGTSTGDWRRVNFTELAEDALAGVRMLKSRTDIDPEKIGLWGGSNGGWVAPLAASLSGDVSFVITVAGAAISPAALVKWRSVNYVRNAGYSDEVVQQVERLMDLQFELVRAEGWEEGWAKYEAELQKVRNEPWFGRLAALRNPANGSWFLPYTASIDFDPVSVYENLPVPVLSILGEADPLLPARETAAILERVKREKNRDITVVILAGADHNLNRPTGPRPVPEYTETMINWIKQKVGR